MLSGDRYYPHACLQVIVYLNETLVSTTWLYHTSTTCESREIHRMECVAECQAIHPSPFFLAERSSEGMPIRKRHMSQSVSKAIRGPNARTKLIMCRGCPGGSWSIGFISRNQFGRLNARRAGLQGRGQSARIVRNVEKIFRGVCGAIQAGVRPGRGGRGWRWMQTRIKHLFMGIHHQRRGLRRGHCARKSFYIVHDVADHLDRHRLRQHISRIAFIRNVRKAHLAIIEQIAEGEKRNNQSLVLPCISRMQSTKWRSVGRG